MQEGEKLNWWEFVHLDGQEAIIPIADTYIFAAWDPIYDKVIEYIVPEKSKVISLWTSSVGEMDFEPIERSFLSHIIQHPRISHVWFGDTSLARTNGPKGFWAPYPIRIVKGQPEEYPKKNYITMFCPSGPKKNILNQLTAIRILQETEDLELYTNVNGYDDILALMKCRKFGWLEKIEYQSKMMASRLNMACSWAETYNYNVAEAALLDTVSVTSNTVPISSLRIKDPNDPLEIADEILSHYNNQNYLRGTVKEAVERLKFLTDECQRRLSQVINIPKVP